ncbi:MAG: mercuric transport protein MerTP [Sphingobacteriales bacterium]|nr:MAG: mercuric transport protein MerTP [Sphingobacteriales bacterium]
MLGAGVLSAMAASLCCITPFVALLAGSSSIAASFSWIEPARQYLIGLSVLVLALAWYTKLKPAKPVADDCECVPSTKPTFWQSKTFLALVTMFAVAMMAFPMYASMFYPKAQVKAPVAPAAQTKQVKFVITGMTCAGCEEHVNGELAKVKGVTAFTTSYASRSSLVTFDPAQTNEGAVADAIKRTGYKVTGYEAASRVSGPAMLYNVPLVCEAAPSIGCGSKAKFLLQDLVKRSNVVEGAWINKKGTMIAVNWTTQSTAVVRQVIMESIGKNHSVSVTERAETIATTTLADSKEWYAAGEVDLLSREEANVIAHKTITDLKRKGLVKPTFERQFEADIAKIYTELFLGLTSFKDLNKSSYDSAESKIQAAGERYAGKGKMPRQELCATTDESCTMGGSSGGGNENSCSTSESCCKKN